MPQREHYEPGTFCWVDVAVPDPTAAITFYGEVFGWEVVDTGMMYWLFTHEGAPVAGLTALTEELQEQGMPPVWSVAIAVDDVDATSARAAELGGSIVLAAQDVSDTGRMAVVADRQGAYVVLWQAAPFPGAGRVNEPGAWAWNDLQTPDPAGATPFYAELFGWDIAPVAESEGLYSTIANDGRKIGGVMQAAPQIEHPFWATYIGVEDVDATIARIEAAGGRQLAGPFEVPAGRFAAVADPQGAMFSLVDGQFDD